MTRYTVNCSILFTELPLLERPAAARAAGFDAVEFWWPFATAAPSGAEVDRFVRAVEDAGVRLTGLNFAAGDMPAGDRGLVSWPGRESEFRDSVDVAAGIGERLGTGVFNALYGNRIPGTDPLQQDDVAVRNLAYAVGRTAATVVLEPISGVPRYPLRTAADALEVADRVAVPNLLLLADLYHLTVNGDDVAAVIAQHSARIGHVQIADAPGRHEPGTGQIPFDRHLAALAGAGYSGWTGLEYVPSTTSDRAFDWLPRSDRRSAERGAPTSQETST
jgi:hydroxypyruvate isomerase